MTKKIFGLAAVLALAGAGIVVLSHVMKKNDKSAVVTHKENPLKARQEANAKAKAELQPEQVSAEPVHQADATVQEEIPVDAHDVI